MYSSSANFPEVLVIVGTGTSISRKHGTITAGAWHVILLHLPTKTVKSLEGTLLSGSRLNLGLSGIVSALESFKRRTTWSLIAEDRIERLWFEHVKRWKHLMFKHRIIRPESKGEQQNLWRRAICGFRRHWNQELPAEFRAVRNSYLKPSLEEAKRKAEEYRKLITLERENGKVENQPASKMKLNLQLFCQYFTEKFTGIVNSLWVIFRRLIWGRFPPLQIVKPKPEDDYRLGERGERYAAWILSQKGYRILARNWHGKHFELDIVAQDGQTLVFIEVKTRRETIYNEPERNIFSEKQRRISHVALEFLESNYWQEPDFRFDTIGIVWPDETTEEPITFRHITDAFSMDDRQ